MSALYVLNLDDPRAALENVGGKGASLARLAQAGLPVPGGFHVTTDAYRYVVAENNLQARILAALEGVDLTDPAALERASQAIGGLFDQARIPADLAAAVVEAYAALPGGEIAVAVRSSATAEDLPEASFAGQQETYLNIQGGPAVLEAVRQCWASLWTGRAIGYRARQGISPQEVALAVVVQQLVPAQAAGILFTANPITGRRDQVVISAAWGLGEAVVGGLVTPDSLIVDKASGRVLERQTADKQVMTARVAGGVQEQPVAAALRQAPVLDDAAAARLTRLAVQIEELYGLPMDIEWALLDGEFAILQARPVTALPEAQLEPPKEWRLPNPKGQYMRGSIVDILPGPLSPLFATLGIPAAKAGVDWAMSLLTRSRTVMYDDYFVVINHYAYLGAYFPPRTWWWIIAHMLPATPHMLRTGPRFWRETFHPRYVEAVARWQDRPVGEMPLSELWRGVTELLAAAMEYLGGLMGATMGASAGSEGLFTQVYEKMVRREGDPPADVFLMGYDSVPIQAEKSIYDLAAWCRQHPRLAGYVLETPAQQLAAQLAGEALPAGLEAQEWGAFRQRFEQYLQRFGHIIFTLDFAHSLPLDNPAPMLESCKMYLRGEGANPHERQAAYEARRLQAVESLSGRVRGWRGWAFRKSLGWAQSLAAVRESALADIGLGYPILRRMLVELGERFVQAGAMRSAEDIYWLETDEVKTGVANLEAGAALISLDDKVQQRKAESAAAKQVTPPPMLPYRERYMGFKMDTFVAASEGSQTGDTLKGVPTSAGQVTAPACVLHGPEDFSQMKPGAVLVAGATTPAWTPLFAMASAVVTDIGGPLSHGSIVAREYGIPAVMGTGVATRRIQNGQTITVDGNLGTVKLSTNGHTQ